MPPQNLVDCAIIDVSALRGLTIPKGLYSVDAQDLSPERQPEFVEAVLIENRRVEDDP